MATEQEYDDIIAPMLAAVAEQCRELGMSIIARVEWEPGEVGITKIGIGPDSGIGQKLAEIAVHAHGNLDSIVIEAVRRYDCSQTIVGNMMKPLTKRQVS